MSPMTLAQTTVELPKYGASSREAQISTARDAAPAMVTTGYRRDGSRCADPVASTGEGALTRGSSGIARTAAGRCHVPAPSGLGAPSLPAMDFETTPRVKELQASLLDFMERHVHPAERTYHEQVQASGNRHRSPPIMEELKAEARSRGLWNLFLPDSRFGAGLTNLEYAPLAEITGRSPLAPEALNCAAPDTGNMEILALFGTPEQQERWLRPLLEGEIRSCFAMTEPEVASSDATNIQSRIVRDGDEYVINGHKWWTSGAADERCRICIFMGKTDPSALKHQQQSMILVPMDTPGLTINRMLNVFGYD